MPETTLEIRVSLREIDRPRLIEVLATAGDDTPLEGIGVRLQINANGTFHESEELTDITIATGSGGLTYVQWYEFPREGPRRDFSSYIVASWDGDATFVYLQDLYE
jgi:hypothetical protein